MRRRFNYTERNGVAALTHDDGRVVTGWRAKVIGRMLACAGVALALLVLALITSPLWAPILFAGFVLGKVAQ